MRSEGTGSDAISCLLPSMYAHDGTLFLKGTC